MNSRVILEMNALCKVFLFSLALTLLCRADMGSIPFKKGVRIFEPKQDAIIAWNGKEQLLYLQTTLSASEDTKVLEVMPLPNKPTVEASDAGVFKRCAFLLPRPPARKSHGMGAFGVLPEEPAGKVVERKMIGAHDLRTVELLDSRRFSEWVAKEFSEGDNQLDVPEPLLTVIDQYAKDGFKWFLFDVIEVRKETAKKTPLRIRFKTDYLYYPMRITRTEKGQTTVSLSVLTNILFNKEDCIGISRDSIKVPAKPREITGTKLHWIDPPLFELLGSSQKTKIRSWEISGQIDSFQKDLLIRNPATVKPEGEQVGGNQPESELNIDRSKVESEFFRRNIVGSTMLNGDAVEFQVTKALKKDGKEVDGEKASPKFKRSVGELLISTDRHMHREYAIKAIGQEGVTVTYTTFFDARSFGGNVIKRESGEFYITYAEMNQEGEP